MTRDSTRPVAVPRSPVGKALDEMTASFERFCLAAGLETLGAMLASDVARLCGPPHVRGPGRRGYRWGRTSGKLGFHGGKVEIGRPRVRGLAGEELALPSWERANAEDWLGRLRRLLAAFASRIGLSVC